MCAMNPPGKSLGLPRQRWASLLAENTQVPQGGIGMMNREETCWLGDFRPDRSSGMFSIVNQEYIPLYGQGECIHVALECA